MRRVSDHDCDDSLPALIVTYGSATRKHRPLDRAVMLVGRGRGCDLALVSPEIAPVHCVLTQGPGGWLIRDCGSRAGTHINGEPIEEALLRDGDTVQIGPFCFRAHLPAGTAFPGPAGDDRAVLHLMRSRRNLALLALALRRRLRDERCRLRLEQERMARVVYDRVRACEEQAKRLGQAERDLAVDREALERESNELHELMVQAERGLAQRQAEVEAALQARWQRFYERCQESEETRRLDLRRQELAHYACYLRRTHEQLRGWEEERDCQRPRPRSDAPHALERNSLCRQPV